MNAGGFGLVCGGGWNIISENMRRRRKYVLLLAIGLVLIGAVAVVLKPEREPEYAGKRLSEWVETAVIESSWSSAIVLSVPSPPSRNSPFGTNPPSLVVPFSGPSRRVLTSEAEDAIRHIGTNAVPYLVNWVAYDPPSLQTELLELMNRTFHSTLIDHRSVRAVGAMKALEALGPTAEGAIPGLALLMNDARAPTTARRATVALSRLQPVLPSAAIALMTNDSSAVRRQSFSMATLWGKASTTSAVPGLVRGLQDRDAKKAEDAAVGLGVLAVEGRIAVPALTKCLKDKRPGVQKAAVEALGQFEGQARPAVPALLQLLSERDFEIRMAAANALLKIDSHALDKVRAE